MTDSGLDARRTDLLDLVNLRVPVQESRDRLGAYAFDEAPNLVEFSPVTAIEVLERLAAGKVGSDEVVAWADAIEGRDDIDYSSPLNGLLSDMLFELATPEIHRPVDSTLALEWCARLRGSDDPPRVS